MLPLLRCRILLVASLSMIAAVPVLAESAIAHAHKPAKYILVGFVGGFVRHDNPHHGPVRLADHMQQTNSNQAYVRVFENRHRKQAYRTILHLLDEDHDGILNAEEKERAHIILFGQSWGAAAAVLLARDLDRMGIPVLLTVQVDSVAKLWQNDRLIPSNVAEAVNFYQPHGLIHGRRDIKAADPSKTEIIGNYRFDYRNAPVNCQSTLSWYDRLITPGHAQSECDPRLWGEVEALVRERMEPQASVAVARPQD